jgi:phage terminase large subunit GpA-like protein
MSDATSKNSPASPSNSVEAFEGEADIRRAFARGLAPDPTLTVSEWADRYRMLSSRASAEAGRYRTDRTPYMRAVMDALSPSHPARRIVFMKAAQVGATEAGNNWLGYCVHQAPGPFLAVQPTTDLAKRLSQQRIDPLIDESPELRALILPARSRESGNTVLSKRFNGGQLVLTGANSAVGLRSMPARYVFLDEVDAYEGDIDGEGDPVALAIARSRTFGHRAKAFLVSTPTIKGLSRIEREFEASDRQRFFVPCPHCGHMQWLRFERLRWETDKPDGATYLCESCEQPIAEYHKTAMLDAGEWRATATATDPFTVGFHISALYSPVGWRSWAALARDRIAAKGNEAALKTFMNTDLGETWQERGEAPDWQRLYDRREDWPVGAVPAGGLILTAGADVQHDRIEVDIWAWGRRLESWLVEHVVLEGDTSRDEVWKALTALVGRTWRHQSGARMTLARIAIDSGDGRNTAAVYGWVRRTGGGQALAVKGSDGFDRSTPVDGPTYVDVNEQGRTIRRGVKLWKVSVGVFKSETYRFLRLERPTDEALTEGESYPDGYAHLPVGLPAEWIKQLVAEQLVTIRDRRGFAKLEWRQMRERNEALDCRVYARAAAWLMGLDRWDEERFEALEETLRIKAEAEAAGRPEAAAKTQARRADWLGPRGKWF